MSDTVLEVHDLSVQFPTRERLIQAVDRISFEVKRGQTLGIVGESGSGKSVTALAVMGLVPTPGQVQGEIWFRNAGDRPVNLLTLPPEQMRTYRGKQIAMIFQEPQSSLNPVYSCGFQLTEALRQHQQISVAEARRRACALLQEVQLLPSDEKLQEQVLAEAGALSTSLPEWEIQRRVNDLKRGMLNRYPHQLSGGQIQRVMIAMAIACEPDLLIADEPTTALDVTVQAAILDLLRELRTRHQMSMMFITHDLGLVAELADTVVVMFQGKIMEVGPVEQVFANPQHPYTKGLLACRPRPDRKLRILPTVADFMEVVTTIDGQMIIQEKQPVFSLDHTAEATEATQAPQLEQRLTELREQPLLLVQDLRVAYPIRGLWGQPKRYMMAVNGISFEVFAGETLGLVGESGCGKTTLARTLLRLVQPTQGRIWFEGREIQSLKGAARQQFHRDVQIIFQDPFSALDPRLTIGEAIIEPVLIHSRKWNRERSRARVAHLLEQVGLPSTWANRYPHELSGGQRQRVCIARALALNPKLIICDESVSALDVSVQAQVLNLLKTLQQEFALTYIFISHDLSVVKFMSDRIMVMNQGKLEEIGPAKQIYEQPQQAYTRRLIAAIPANRLEQIQHQRK